LSASTSYLRLPPFPHFGRAGAAPVCPHRARARRMGRHSAWLARTSSDRCARMGRVRLRWDSYLSTPRRIALGHVLCGGGGCHLPSPGSRPGGNRGNSHCFARRCASKARERSKPQSPSHQPRWGFLSPFSPACIGRGEEGGCAATTPGRKDREPTVYKVPELREADVMDTYPACVHLFTEPATTTPPPHREHHRVRPILSSPLVSFL
jgi:hypothetical protein